MFSWIWLSEGISTSTTEPLPQSPTGSTQAEGRTVVRDAHELRVKETDRIATTVGELARQMIDLLSDPEKRRQQAERALVYAEENCWNRRREDYLDIVDSLCGTRPVSRSAALHARDSHSPPASTRKKWTTLITKR